MPRRTTQFKMAILGTATVQSPAVAPYDFFNNTSLSTLKYDLIMYVYIIGLSLLNVSSLRAGFLSILFTIITSVPNSWYPLKSVLAD